MSIPVTQSRSTIVLNPIILAMSADTV